MACITAYASAADAAYEKMMDALSLLMGASKADLLIAGAPQLQRLIAALVDVCAQLFGASIGSRAERLIHDTMDKWTSKDPTRRLTALSRR